MKKAMAAVIAILTTGVLGSAAAQTYPSHPIRLVVPFGPGGGSDFTGRLIAQKLTEQMGQQVVVDNRAGAASLIGTEIVLHAPADGYTLLLADSGLTINLAYYRNAKYNPVKDFAPISMLAETPYSLIVNPSLPYAGSAKEFIAAVKQQPDRMRIGSAGNGSGTHFSGELFRLAAGLKMIHVPYKGGGAMLTDLVANHIESAIATPAIVLPFVKQGRIRILAQGPAKRSPFLPDVPTFGEVGYPDVVLTNWFGVMSVGGTPQPVVKRLQTELHKAIASPDLREKFSAAVLEPRATSPEEFSKHILADVDRWKRVMRETGIRQE